MNIREFLELVVATEGIIGMTFAWEFDGKSGFTTFPCKDHATAAKAAQALDEQGKTVYFPLATFKEQHRNKRDKPRISRKHKNVDFLRSIWLDIDYKDCPKEELVPKLSMFLKETELPPPSAMVSSGGGLHIYWAADEDMTVERWVPLAEGLKRLCKEHALPADHVCTSDMARVLRPVGTHNRKYYPEKEVKFLGGSKKQYPYDTLLEKMPEVDTNALPAHLRGKATVNGEYSETGSVRREVSTKQVIQKCAVLRHIMKTQGAEQSEPEWNATLLLLRFLDDGAKLVHPMSKGHVAYDPDATNEKWQQKLEADVTGPPLCSTFEQYGHEDRCKGCPIYKSQKMKTPLALGYVSDVPQTPKAIKLGKVHPIHQMTLPADPPNGWRVMAGNEGMERRVFEDGEYTWKQVLNRAWRILRASTDIETSSCTLTISAKQITGKERVFDIPGKALGSGQALLELIGDKGIVFQKGELDHWRSLMGTWLADIQKANAEENATSRYGWINDPDEDEPVGFAFGDKVWYRNGDIKESVRVRHDCQQIAALYQPKGRLDKWREAADYITEQGHPAFLSILASAFAGPLVTFTPQEGVTMTIVSNESGVGKTSAMRAAQAVWGQPHKAMNSTTDTHLSITKKLGFIKNLPAYWDEIRGERALENFYQVAFDVAQGKERTRLSQSASMQVVNEWCTLMVGASNESLMSFMGGKSGVSNATLARTLELTIDEGEVATDLSAGPLFSALKSNHGKAGEVYAAHLAKRYKKIKKRVQKRYDRIIELIPPGDAGEQRFYAATVTVLLIGMEEANKCGLTKFDVEKMAEYYVDLFKAMKYRADNLMNVNRPAELVAAYEHHHMNEVLQIDHHPAQGERGYSPTVYHMPKNDRIKIVKAGNVYRVRKGDFAKWLQASCHISFDSVAKALAKELNMKVMKVALGHGTRLAVSRSEVLEFHMPGDGDE